MYIKPASTRITGSVSLTIPPHTCLISDAFMTHLSAPFLSAVRLDSVPVVCAFKMVIMQKTISWFSVCAGMSNSKLQKKKIGSDSCTTHDFVCGFRFHEHLSNISQFTMLLKCVPRLHFLYKYNQNIKMHT